MRVAGVGKEFGVCRRTSNAENVWRQGANASCWPVLAIQYRWHILRTRYKAGRWFGGNPYLYTIPRMLVGKTGGFEKVLWTVVVKFKFP